MANEQLTKTRVITDKLKLSYLELLSPEPVKIQNVGSIISPKLRDITSIGYNNYQYYLSILLLDTKTYLSLVGYFDNYNLTSESELSQINIFDLLTMHEQSCLLLQDILNFFIKEDIVYSPERNGFVVKNDSHEIGMITKEIYAQVCDLICQRNCIKSKQEEDLSKVKSKKALEILEKIKKGREGKSKQTKADKNMELGNIISAVANKSHSLNILNIWDLTVFQLWDCFSRLSNNNIYDIQSMSVAAWGDKDNHFDATIWFKRIDTDN